jgi:hypothetical protein
MEYRNKWSIRKKNKESRSFGGREQGIACKN